MIYIIKENRTYDQVLGKLGKGNSDPSLTLFDETTAPNHYKLAREFVLFDNFYVNADVSADGHNWATAGIAPDYTQKLWPSSYAKRRNFYDFEGGEPANSPPAGYIWAQRRVGGPYGAQLRASVNNKKEVGADGVQITGLRDPSLTAITNKQYRGFDLDYPGRRARQGFPRRAQGIRSRPATCRGSSSCVSATITPSGTSGESHRAAVVVCR